MYNVWCFGEAVLIENYVIISLFFSSILFSSWIILVKNFLNLTCHFFKEPLLIRSLLMTEDFHPRNFVSVLQIWNSFPFIFSLFWSSSWFFLGGGLKSFNACSCFSYLFHFFLWLLVLFICVFLLIFFLLLHFFFCSWFSLLFFFLYP